MVKSNSLCPYCGVNSCHELYYELAVYTVAQGHEYLIEQHMIDTHCAQHATDETKPIAVIFALMDLCLWLGKGPSGRQVQRVHVLFGKRKKATGTCSTPPLPWKTWSWKPRSWGSGPFTSGLSMPKSRRLFGRTKGVYMRGALTPGLCG
jgi:hypothetical protein